MTELSQDTRVVIGTHHKAGTNFGVHLSRVLGEHLGLTLWDRGSEPEPAEWGIYFDHWCRWATNLDFPFFGIHIVRNPRSLVYSAMKYHLAGAEPAFRKARDDFGGKSYQEILQDMSTDGDRLIFEMDHTSGGTLRDMREVAADQRFFRLKLEDVSHDREMTAILELSDHLSSTPATLAKQLRKHCLWWKIEKSGKPFKHSTTAMSDEWRRAFVGAAEERFLDEFAGLSEKLAYTN